MKPQENEPRYVISIAAKIIGIETHTLRYYEKIGLVQPFRSQGNVRYYSESDIEQLRQIKTLICDMGINPAGVEVVTRMVRKMKGMQQQIDELTAELEILRQHEPETTKDSGTEAQE
jgi:MerR family transcriptional regulator/heat shock protein HspR